MKSLMLLFLLAFSTASWAEGGCPPGQYPQQGQGWQSCVPIPGQSSGGQTNQTAAVFADRWQAIATDTTKAILGTSKDLATAAEAESTAMNDCKAKGGTECRISLSYSNGCIAMSVGNTLLTTGYGATRKDAEKSAVSACSIHGDASCTVYYSECSYAKRLQ